MEDLRRVSRWHGQVVNPKLTATTAADLVARVQARSRRDAKRTATAKVSFFSLLLVHWLQGMAWVHYIMLLVRQFLKQIEVLIQPIFWQLRDFNVVFLQLASLCQHAIPMA